MALPIIPNIALERDAEYCQLAHDKPTGFANAGLVWVLLKASGLEADTVLRDYANLDALLKRGGGSQVAEASFTGYSRLAVTNTNISITVDNVNDKVLIDITVDPSWDPTTVEDIGAIALCFDPDTTGGTDADIIPLFVDACVETTGTGGAATPLTYVVATNGYNSGVQA